MMTVRLSGAALALSTTLAMAAPTAAAAAPPWGAAGLRVEHAAARVIVIPEARSNVSVTVQGGDARLPRLQVRVEGGMIVADGGLEHRIGDCGGYGAVFSDGSRRDQTMRVLIRGVGPLTLDRLPVITARVPLNTFVTAGDAVWGEIGPTNSLQFSNTGCGDWRVADVHGPLQLSLAGSGDVRAGRAGAVTASVGGSGDMGLAEVGALDARVAGSGDIRVKRVDGPLSARIAGSGDIVVEGGRAPNLAAAIAGSGDIRFNGEAGAVAARIAGSGDVRVLRASGPVSRSVMGSGDVIVGR